jgi:hypothetical protein
VGAETLPFGVGKIRRVSLAPHEKERTPPLLLVGIVFPDSF